LLSVAGLVLPATCIAVPAPAPTVAAEPQPWESPAWTVEPMLQDPADTPDDDDDPDAQQDASSAIAAARGFSTGIASDWRLVRADAPSLSSRALEGHYLRGPPSVDQDSSDVDDDGDDDDDNRLETASTSLSPGVRAFSIPSALRHHHVRSHAHDRQWLRAP
jgi:hypothetical protein